MIHFSILSVLLQYTHRDLSARKVRKLAKLSQRTFQRAKGQFRLPTPQIIAKSKSRPVRLILDYVLISRNSKTLTFPFNLLFNPNTKQYGPTLCVLFALAELDGKYYPVAFDFWTQHEWDPEGFLSKLRVASVMIESLYEQGLVIQELLFDAGFCSAAFLDELDALKIPYICRMKSSWGIQTYGSKRAARSLFGLGKPFFFDRHKRAYLFSRKGRFGKHQAKLVAIANSREDLEKKQFYCLITNQLTLKPTQVVRHYLQRGKIEWFFKIMKTYLGLCAFFRHDPDEGLIPHFEMRCAAFVLLQEIAHESKLTIAETLHKLSRMTTEQVRNSLTQAWSAWADFLVVSTTPTMLNPLNNTTSDLQRLCV
jgi:hypothetical protein